MPLVEYAWAEVLGAEWPGAEWSLRGDDLDTLEWVGEGRPSKAEIANRAAAGWLKAAKAMALGTLDAVAAPEDEDRKTAAVRGILSAATVERVEQALLSNGWDV